MHMSLLQHADFLLALQMNEEQYQKVSIYNVVRWVLLLHRHCFALNYFTDSFGFWNGASLKLHLHCSAFAELAKPAQCVLAGFIEKVDESSVQQDSIDACNDL